MKAAGTGTTSITGIDVANAGAIVVLDGSLSLSSLTSFDPLAKTLDGEYYLAGPLTFAGADVVTNNGAIDLLGPNAAISDGVLDGLRNLAANSADAVLAVENDANLTIADDLVNDGEVLVGIGSTVTVTDDYLQSAAGRLTSAAISDLPTVADVGRLTAGGQAILDGALGLHPLSFPPAPGAEFDVVTAGALAGTFASTDLGGYDAIYEGTTVALASNVERRIELADISVQEGDAGPATAELTLRLTHPHTRPVSVWWQTADLSANAADDYTAVPSTQVTFDPGDETKTLTVDVAGDTVHEHDEAFQVKLFTPSAARLADRSAVVRILDEEGPLFVRVGDTRAGESDGDASVDVTLSAPPAPGQVVTLDLATTDGTASALDYTAGSATLTFDESTGAQQTALVPILDDGDDEPNETVNARISQVSGALVADNAAVLRIEDDDGAAAPVIRPSVSIDDVAVLEGGTAAFDVRLSHAVATPVTMSYATQDLSATAADDYTAVAATPLTFDPGETTKTVTVDVDDDAVHELTEQFRVVLTAVSGAYRGDVFGRALVLDDEGPITIAIDGIAPREGNAGTHSTTVTVSLSDAPAPGQTIAVDLATLDGTATLADGDYQPLTQTLTFTEATGRRLQFEPLLIGGDTVDEPEERFAIRLSLPVGARIEQRTGSVRIRDDD